MPGLTFEENPPVLWAMSGRELMARAWGMVDPSIQAGIKLRAGRISPHVALATTWKAPIDVEVSRWALREAGIRIEDIAAAVRFYTATDATIEPTPTGYHVTAPGYGRGPAR